MPTRICRNKTGRLSKIMMPAIIKIKNGDNKIREAKETVKSNMRFKSIKFRNHKHSDASDDLQWSNKHCRYANVNSDKID